MSEPKCQKCPFCGGPADVRMIYPGEIHAWIVGCQNNKCHAWMYRSFTRTNAYDSKELAIRAWNRRAE